MNALEVEINTLAQLNVGGESSVSVESFDLISLICHIQAEIECCTVSLN